MATLGITNDEIYKNLATVLGISRVPTQWDSSTVSDVNRIVRAGRRRFFGAHPWAFLEMNFPAATASPIEDGTIEIVDGVVTLTGSTWPTDVLLYKFIPQDGGVYDVVTRTSDTEIILHDTSVQADALSTYQIVKTKFVMPSTFGGFLAPVTIENNLCVQECYSFPDFTLRAVGNLKRPRFGKPQLFAVSSEPDTESGIPIYYFNIYPLPDQTYIMNSKIRIQPGDSLDSEEEVCHPAFSELLQEAILAAAEDLYNGTKGVHWDNYQSMLPAYIKKDQSMKGTRRVTPFGKGVTYPQGYEYMTADVTWVTD